MILVAGGTGRLGHLVATELAATGHRVRVLSRGLRPPADPSDARVQVVVGDVRDPRSVQQAMRDVDVVVSAVQGFVGPGDGTPASVDRDGNRALVAEASRRGADVVLVSVAGASAEAAWELCRMKFAAEQALVDSGCAWTVLRPAAYAQTWLEVLQDSAGRSRRPKILGRGDNPIPWVDVHDVAVLVVRAVGDRALRGRTLDLVGPERLTLDELARLLMAGLGWPGTPQHVPRAVVGVVAATIGRARPQVRRICQAALAMDGMTHPDDHETRDLLPWLPATPVSRVITPVASAGLE